jgi:2'-5' RNA ligase
MAFAITLRFDPESASRVAGLWRALATEGIDTDRDRLGYAAHITLAVCPDGAATERSAAALARLAGTWRPLPVTLSGFGVFPKPESILWAAPVVTAELLACHAELHAALSGLPAHPHYRPGAWMPHVTLSGPLRDPARALAALLPLWTPIAGWLCRADLVSSRPVRVLQSHALPS